MQCLILVDRHEKPLIIQKNLLFYFSWIIGVFRTLPPEMDTGIGTLQVEIHRFKRKTFVYRHLSIVI